MAEIYSELTPEQQQFIANQHVFFVGTAPLSADSDVNVSPKGYDTFRILSAREVAYLDLTGSGNETSGHLDENGRITVMFCAFEGPPLILRIYGRGEVILPGNPRWNAFSQHFPAKLGTRQIIVVHIRQVQTSCGYGVPRMEYQQDRDTLDRWAASKGEQGIADYQLKHNRVTRNGRPTSLGRTPDMLVDG